MKYRLLTLATLTFLTAPLMAATSWPVRPGADLTFLISPGYHSFLTDAYDDVTGGYGWVGGDFGLLIRANDRLSFQPKIAGYFNSLKLKSGFGGSEETYTNTLGVPALGVKYALYQGETLEFDINGELGVPLISSDLPGLTMKGDGVEFAISGGLRFNKSLDIQLGYNYVPIKVTPDYVPSSAFFGSPSNLTETKTYNFGGVFISAGYYF